MGMRTTVQRAAETYSRDQLYADLRNEARRLVRQMHATTPGNRKRGYTKAALDIAAERFYGAMEFVSRVTNGIPDDERDVDGSDFRQIYWDAKEASGQLI